MKIIEPAELPNSITVLLQEQDLSNWRPTVTQDEIRMTFDFATLNLVRCSVKLRHWVEEALSKKAKAQAWHYQRSLNARKHQPKPEKPRQFNLFGGDYVKV